jgi:acyl-coenzyme A thioesterase PaaI-like protein
MSAKIPAPAPEPDAGACERLAEAARRAIDAVRRAAAPAATLEEAAALLERAAALLEPHGHPGPFAQSGLDASRRQGGAFLRATPAETFPYSPVIGPRNPLAPPVHCEMRDGEIHARVRFGAPYAGAPGLVHGGIIAAAFDEVLGVLNVMQEQGGMTGMLTVKYRAPTPLDQVLRLVGRHERTVGRRVHARGQLFWGDTLTAEAEGLFIRVPPGQIHRLAALGHREEPDA